MDSNYLIEQLNQKRTDLDSSRRLRDYAIQCHAHLLFFVNDSKLRLQEYIKQDPEDLERINQLKEQLEFDEKIYICNQEIVMEHHADIEMTQIELNNLEQRFNALFHKKKDVEFYKPKKDNFSEKNNPTSSTIVSLLNS